MNATRDIQVLRSPAEVQQVVRCGEKRALELLKELGVQISPRRWALTEERLKRYLETGQ